MTRDSDSLIPKHGGYENTKTWQLADLIYDVTVRFCDKYVDPRSRTHDQMVQAARSGCQNLQEGSVDSAVSKKIELKLTGIAKGSLKELERDYKKFLKHRDLPEWPPRHPALMRFKALQCASLEQFRAWVAKEVRRAEQEKNTNRHGRSQAHGDDSMIPKHGGYENTKTWQLADLIYDVTVRFCDKYVDRRSRTHDQMVQAARSGCQNLQEGSVDSAVSKKIEMKLTGIAKGSLMELQRDFKKFLKHRDLPEWSPYHPALMRFKALQCATLDQFRAWVADEMRRDGQGRNTDGEKNTEKHGLTHMGKEAPRSGVPGRPCQSMSVRVSRGAFPAVCAANGALSLLNLCIHLIGNQMEAQAAAFEKEGGFTERLYKRRTQRRNQGRN